MFKWIINIFKKKPDPIPDLFYCEIRSNWAHDTCHKQCTHCEEEAKQFSTEDI